MSSEKIEKIFNSFEGARFFAMNFARYFEVSIRITRLGELYCVSIPGLMRMRGVEKFVAFAYLLNDLARDQLLSILDDADNSLFTSSDLVWFDSEAGLAWDRQGLLLTQSIFKHHPERGAEVMNRVKYGGLDGWRLPTLEELKTLNLLQLERINKHLLSGIGAMKFWSSETAYERCYFDVDTMRVDQQHYIEHDNNRVSYGDGYTKSAHTIMVSSWNSA